MITRMNKLTFLIYHKEYDAFLQQIRQLGVVHIVEKQSGEMDENLQSFVQKRASYKSLLQAMQNLAEKPLCTAVHSEKSADALVAEYDAYQSQLQALRLQLPALEKDIALMQVWGEFDWESVNKLKAAGYCVEFYACNEKEFDAAWGEAYNAVQVASDGKLTYFVTVTAAPTDIPVEPMRMPTLSLSQLEAEKQAAAAKIEEVEQALKAFATAELTTLEAESQKLQGNIDLLTVKNSAESMAEGHVALLEGWIPEENKAEVVQFLDESGVYYEIRNAHKEDNAPIKLKNNAFTRMYEVWTGMYGMPDYAEFDPTPLVAPFFTLFFAFCMGDAGYGVVLVLLGFLLKSKMGPSMKGMMNLVITLGIATTVIGAVLGTFFGMNLVDVELPECVKSMMVVGKLGDTGYDKQMVLALCIGVVHISIAMTVKAIASTVRYGFKESLSAWGWLLLVVGGVIVATLGFFSIIPENVTTWAFYAIGGVSAIGIYLLNNIRRNVFANIGAGLWDTYNMVTGLMGDILSYIRLYALGLAGAMLGGVFNQLAMMVNEAAGPYVGWLFCGLILVFGHTLNIAMSCLSAFVHPLRLTFVEYFKNSGYDGKGEKYRPFTTVK